MPGRTSSSCLSSSPLPSLCPTSLMVSSGSCCPAPWSSPTTSSPTYQVKHPLPPPPALLIDACDRSEKGLKVVILLSACNLPLKVMSSSQRSPAGHPGVTFACCDRGLTTENCLTAYFRRNTKLLTDNAAVGFFFGRTPLIKLSPKKTWEGFFGGLVLTVISSWFLAEFLSRFNWMMCPRTVRAFLLEHALL